MITLQQQKISNTPLLATPSLLSNVNSVLQNHTIATAQQKLEAEQERTAKYKSLKANLPANTGLIQISGILVAGSMGNLEALCGMTSYQSILNQMFAYTQNTSIKRVLLHISSGGGEAYKVFSSCKEVKDLAQKHGIELVAYADGTCASAAYAWASIADQIISHPESNNIGSIGVVMQLVNDSKALEQKGLDRTFVFSGNSKIPFDQNGAFRADFISDLQAKIDETYNTFVNHVSTNRKMTKQDVIKTEAKTFTAKKAMSLKLIDLLMTESELFEYLGKPIIGSKQPVSAPTSTPSASKVEVKSDIKTEQATEKLRDLQSIVKKRLNRSEDDIKQQAIAKLKQNNL
ncbi:S49 family peptidase [Vibrio casei]|uniref:S49 family peptidase n=1 Tax=Vibrio casei TaxID=673372 RepID=UPI000DA679A2|nr:S49 family peptidase [Vibrio casei]